MAEAAKTKSYTPLIVGTAIALPLAVALLFFVKIDVGFDPYILPAINAVINGITTLLLIAGFFAIKSGNIALHKRFMTAALVMSVLFLLCYVTYHAISESTPFGGEGTIKIVYLVILLSHIVLAAAIVPLVLITVIRAWSERFDKHRKIARITLPLWLYVSITGVIVYLMISPYYP